MSTQVTYEIDYIPVFRDSTISSALYFLCALYDNLKEKDYIKRNKNSKKTNVYVGNQYYCYLGLSKIGVILARTTTKLSCLCLSHKK